MEIKYTAQLYISGGYQQPLDGPLAAGTPYIKVSDTHINFLLPCPYTDKHWPESYIDGRWEV